MNVKSVERMNNKVLLIKTWNTINYPQKKIGSAEIKIISYPSGIYHMQGVNGYKYFEVLNKIRVTTLKINGKTVMVDDPLHWYGMEGLARNSHGKVLVAGLGLGLIVHHLINYPAVSKIDVYEINKEVIELIIPLLPKDKRINIINDDFFKEPFKKKHYDTIILDLWVGKNNDFKICGTNEKVPIFSYYARVKANYPNSKVFVWGVKILEMNPSIG